MPRLMVLGMWFSVLYVLGAITLVALAAVGIGYFTMGDREMDSREWLQVSGPLLVLTAAMMAGIAYGFRTEKAWSRHLVMVMWGSLGLYGLVTGVIGVVPPIIMLQVLVRAVVFGGIAAWYFYAKRNVVEYFKALAQDEK
jgi:hypothetical protein